MGDEVNAGKDARTPLDRLLPLILAQRLKHFILHEHPLTIQKLLRLQPSMLHCIHSPIHVNQMPCHAMSFHAIHSSGGGVQTNQKLLFEEYFINM